MKRTLFITLAMLIVYSTLTLAQTKDKMENQDEETKAAIQEFKLVDAELTTVFNNLLTLYKADTEFIKNIKESQDIWIKFRAAELKTKFPDRNPGAYGSVHTMCVNDYLTELTNARITSLKVWLQGTYEGDVCSGSVKINE